MFGISSYISCWGWFVQTQVLSFLMLWSIFHAEVGSFKHTYCRFWCCGLYFMLRLVRSNTRIVVSDVVYFMLRLVRSNTRIVVSDVVVYISCWGWFVQTHVLSFLMSWSIFHAEVGSFKHTYCRFWCRGLYFMRRLVRSNTRIVVSDVVVYISCWGWFVQTHVLSFLMLWSIFHAEVGSFKHTYCRFWCCGLYFMRRLVRSNTRIVVSDVVVYISCWGWFVQTHVLSFLMLWSTFHAEVGSFKHSYCRLWCCGLYFMRRLVRSNTRIVVCDVVVYISCWGWFAQTHVLSFLMLWSIFHAEVGSFKHTYCRFWCCGLYFMRRLVRSNTRIVVCDVVVYISCGGWFVQTHVLSFLMLWSIFHAEVGSFKHTYCRFWCCGLY